MTQTRMTLLKTGKPIRQVKAARTETDEDPAGQKVDPKIIGMRLRKLRGIRVRNAMARELGISCSALYQYESGQKVPRDGIKVKLADYLGVSVQELFFDPE